MTSSAIGKRLFPELKLTTHVTIINRFLKTMEKIGVKVNRQVDYDSGARIFEFWITDPFWRDKVSTLCNWEPQYQDDSEEDIELQW